MKPEDASPEMIAAALAVAEAAKASSIMFYNEADYAEALRCKTLIEKYRDAVEAAGQPWKLDGHKLYGPNGGIVHCGRATETMADWALARALLPILNENAARIEAAIKEAKP